MKREGGGGRRACRGEVVADVDERVSVGDWGFIVDQHLCGLTLLRLRYNKLLCFFYWPCCTSHVQLRARCPCSFSGLHVNSLGRGATSALRNRAKGWRTHSFAEIHDQQLHRRQLPVNPISRPPTNR